LLRLPALSSNQPVNVLRFTGSDGIKYYVSYRRRGGLDMLPPDLDGQILVNRLDGDENSAKPTNFVTKLSQGNSIQVSISWEDFMEGNVTH
jgi:hypothetical protein